MANPKSATVFQIGDAWQIAHAKHLLAPEVELPAEAQAQLMEQAHVATLRNAARPQAAE